MRVAIFSDQLFYNQPGGIGTYLRHLVPGLAARLEGGSLVLVNHGPEGAPRFTDLSRVEEVRLPLRRDTLGILWHTLGRPRLERYLGALDLVHAPSLVYPPSRAPLVATIHDLGIIKYPQTFLRRWRLFHRRGLRAILRHARVILVDSESTKSDLFSLQGKEDSRIRVVPLGVDVPISLERKSQESVLKRYGLKPGFILFVGTLEPRKNLSRLVEAYDSLRRADSRKAAQLVLVGAQGWIQKEELARLTATKGVKWLGHLPQEDLEAVYEAAGLLAYPTLYEGFGLPVLEAMARGLPVITSNSSALREVGEGAALLVDPENTADLAKALRRLIEDENLRAELGEEGRLRALQYPWERTCELTWKGYQAALGRT